MAMNLHKGDNVNRLHSKVIDTIPYTFKHELLTIKTTNIMTMLQTERQALHYEVIANTAHKVEKIARQLATLYNDSYINNNEINRNLKNLERYYDELKLYLDK